MKFLLDIQQINKAQFVIKKTSLTSRFFYGLILFVKNYCKKSNRGKLSLFSPGIGIQGGSAFKAKKCGSDYLIVGRTILNSKNPVQTIKSLVDDSII